jgi:hypothetical protein
VVEFLRDTWGSESLGIAYAGLYMKVAPAGAPGGIDAPLLVSLGTMADRLARRASTEAADGAAAQQLEVAQSWGIGFTSVERPDGIRTCYDGAAFRQALALAPSGNDLAAPARADRSGVRSQTRAPPSGARTMKPRSPCSSASSRPPSQAPSATASGSAAP